ncbi:platelet glycoprotein V isoform X1 [Triplophysa rosa]|uniref:Platelet glycoprotein V n=1 Tax=Triplophysa rosa TaxID=992332 RepID=A0A9W7T648_TRIRA|nr:platelet glycoprotein V isoform X1 [Triplophysa rosa]KAI7791375.1 putative platelet glycoprotein V [Triplophysa rosa]
MWFTIILLQLLPHFTLSVHCPGGCVCDIRGFVKCTGDITAVPPLDPTTTFLLLLNDTQIQLLQERSFQPFHLLLRLRITHSSLDTIHPEAFYDAPQLRSIKLSSNALSVFPPKVFGELSNLEQLQLDDNQIVSISSGLFEGLLNLTELDISNNHISQLDADVFQSLTKLIFLYLAGNRLRNLPGNVFHNLSQLESLVLTSNQLETLESGLFDHLNNLLVLMLQKNQICEIPPHIFWHMPALHTLSMSGNKLQYIPPRSFYYLPNLTKLTLYKNPLISLPDQLVGHMPRLQELYLYETNLVTVPWNLFANMTGLKWLHLHLNDNLTSLPKDLFCCLPKLNKLSIKHNNLLELHPDIFSSLPSLQILLLNENKLRTLPEQIFRHTPRLQTLDLKNNHLRYLTGDVFIHAGALKVLSLSGNRWNCNCSIMGIAEWIQENPTIVNDLEKGVVCREPYKLLDRPLQSLTYEDLQCGPTTYMTSTSVATKVTSSPPTLTITRKDTGTTGTAPVSTSILPFTSTSAVTSLFSPTAEESYIIKKIGYNNQPGFYNTIVLDSGPDIVHNNHYNGWVYLWTVPSTGLFSGFMVALYIVLLVVGVVIIAASLCALYRLHKVMWTLGEVAIEGHYQRITTKSYKF